MSSKKSLQDLSSKGISKTYKTHFGSLTHYLEKIDEKADPRTKYLARRAFTTRKIPRYDEAFNTEEYEGVITPQNQNTVLELNSTIDEINRIRGMMDPTKDSHYEELTGLRKKLLGFLSD